MTGPQSLSEARAALATEWMQLNPQSEDSIASFYKNTKNYIPDLNAWHDMPGRQYWTNVIVGLASVNKSEDFKVLDIGAGAGHDLYAIKAAKSDARLFAVEPNDEMRELLREHDVTAFESIEDVPTGKFFSLITCIDVLEHIPNPESLLETMDRLLLDKGLFIEATATHDIDTPLHLSSLRGWDPSRWLDAHGYVIATQSDRLRAWQKVSDKRDDAENIVLCAYRTVTAETASALLNMKELGYRVNIFRGDALISRIRAIATSEWYQKDGNDVFLMIDDDIIFSPEDAKKVIELAREKRSIASAPYPVRGGTHFASRLYDLNIDFGPTCEPIEIVWAGTGFIAIHRDVIDALVKTMPLCIQSHDVWYWPMFTPMVYHNEETGYDENLSEDWAFCERARQLGFKIWMDRSVYLRHVGLYEYSIHNMRGMTPILEGDESEEMPSL